LTPRAEITTLPEDVPEIPRLAGATIAAGYPRALLEYAVTRGADRDTLLKRSGLDAAALEGADNRVALERYLALFEAAIALTHDPALALHFGEAVRMQEISIVGLIAEAAETTAEVGRQLNRYARLMVDPGGPPPEVFRPLPGKDGIWMEIGEMFSQSPYMVEAELARLVFNTRATFSALPEFQALRFPKAVQFTHREPAYRAEYERIFAAPLSFGCEKNAFQVDPAFLALRQPPTNRYVFGVLSKHAEALLAALEAERSTRARVESVLMPILHTGDANMDNVARRMGMSRRTLQRRLGDEDVTFERVLDQLRHKLALHYLQGKKVSANETAYLVGFSEPAAFSRAFKRWTGRSPGKSV
jgi:AraC-like DNA-binding protein